jgi:hypothetical protein
MTQRTPQELAYWLTLALRLEGVPRRTINGLVLTADRRANLGLLDLVSLQPGERPAVIDKYTEALDRLLEAEGRVSAQAFVVERLSAMGARVVPITDQDYPAHLARRLQPDRAPTVLMAVGATEIWSTPGVAISGSRSRWIRRPEVGRTSACVCGEAGGSWLLTRWVDQERSVRGVRCMTRRSGFGWWMRSWRCSIRTRRRRSGREGPSHGPGSIHRTITFTSKHWSHHRSIRTMTGAPESAACSIRSQWRPGSSTSVVG